MFRFLLIVGIIFYAIYKIGTLFFRAGAASQQHRNYYRPPNGNVNVDHDTVKNKKDPKYKGGEYIDYEEIK
jgi:hypothetical protein